MRIISKFQTCYNKKERERKIKKKERKKIKQAILEIIINEKEELFK